MKKQKVLVTMRSVIQRINRKLKPDSEMLKITRGERMRQSVGDYYVLDFNANAVMRKDVDPEKMGRELGVLKDWEEVVEKNLPRKVPITGPIRKVGFPDQGPYTKRGD